MGDEDCKAIEQHIKNLLFNKTLPVRENSPNVSDFLEQKSPEVNYNLDVNQQPPNKRNHHPFGTAISPPKGFKVTPVFQNQSPSALYQERIREFTNHLSGSPEQCSYLNVCNSFSPPKFQQITAGSSYVYGQARDPRYQNIQLNSDQMNGGSLPFAGPSGTHSGLKSHVQLEMFPDKVPQFPEKLYGDKMSSDNSQASSHQTGNKNESQKDAKNRKKKRKERKKKTKHTSPENSVSEETANDVQDLLGDAPVIDKNTAQEKFMPLSKKGDSPISLPLKSNEFVKQVNKKALLSEDKEYVILKREGQFYFFCYACDYTCSDPNGMCRHITSSNHDAQLKAKEMRHLLVHLPEPLPKQKESVTNCIIGMINTHGLSEDDIKLRQSVVNHIKGKIESYIPGCHLEPIGSSITGFGLKVSHVDIVLKVPKEKNAADMLFTTFEMLKEDKSFKDVHNEFRKKIPQIEFVDVESDLTCNICIDNGTVSEFTKLLCAYAKLDSRARVLGMAFRYWAKVCEIDQQDQGTLPPFCYILMVIYFLQQQQPPVLPVIQKLPESDYSEWHSENTASVGDLWIRLFRYYGIEYQCGEDVVCIRKSEKVSCEDKNWGTKILAIEDPLVHRNLAHVIPNRQIYQYMHDCFIRTYNYFGRPQLASGPAELSCVNPKTKEQPLPDDCKESKKGDLTSPSAEIKKSSSFSEASLSDDILNISDLVEDHDPELPFDDVISIVNNLTLDEIVSEEEFERDSSDSLAEWQKNAFDNCRAQDISPSLFSNFPSLTIIAPPQVPELSKTGHDQIERKDQSHFGNNSVLNVAKTFLWNLGKENDVEEMHYEFVQEHFRGDKAVPLVCNLCQKQGHQKKNCPDEILPALMLLPSMTSEYIKMLNSVCGQIMGENEPSIMEMKMRDADLQDLEEYIQQIFPDARLQMFGSFCNGFGFSRSDMDICLTFKENVTGKDLKCLEIIEQLADKLCQNPMLSNVVPITSAKVPIVKFVFRETGLEGDISLYNTLAQHNTRMLDLYGKIDQRVRVLGYTLKYFAKILNIGDASRGSLSSYAYILMVLFFLQQRNPPVIPVLQELHDGKQPILMVDEWNAWFYNDLQNLPSVWPEYGKNKETVGELWLGLLRFYTEEFDSNEHVVCIRQKRLLTRFRKLWNSKSIAIEDPFDLSHNLGSGLSRRMNNFILKAFIRGRNHFGMSVGRMPSGVSAKDYLFDRRVLCEGQDPPNDRGCRYCSKIGHVIKDCPKKLQKKQDQRRSNGPKNQNSNHNMAEDQMPTHRHGFVERRGYPRKEYDKRNRHHGNRSPRSNSHQQNLMKGGLERIVDVTPGKINHLLSLQRFPPPGLPSGSFNPPPFANKIPNFVHRPVTSTPFPIMNSAHVTSLSPHKNSLTQHTAMYLSQPQNHPTSHNSAQGEISRCLTGVQKNAFLSNEHSFSHVGAHPSSGQISLHSAGKPQQFRGNPRDDVFGTHNITSRW